MAMIHHNILSISRLFICIIALIALAACSSISSSHHKDIDIYGNADQNLQYYMTKASTSAENNFKYNWQLMAVKAALNEKQLVVAQEILTTLKNENLNSEQQWQLSLLKSYLQQQLFLQQEGKLNDQNKVDNIALLLPLSGKLKAQATQIRNGFILAMGEDITHQQMKLTIIDTDQNNIADIIAQITQEQIDFIVGPLQKDKITSFQQEWGHHVATQENNISLPPMLALNIPDNLNRNEYTNVCYFSLSPEQEAMQAAQYMFDKGMKMPLVLVAKNDFGSRIAKAFEQKWNSLSNASASIHTFGNRTQIQRDIQTALGITQSQKRMTTLNSLLNMQLIMQARSRRDIDSIYISAHNLELEFITSFIEININNDAKYPIIFASSRSNDDSAAFDNLPKITYSDIPLIIHPNMKLQNKISAIWHEQSNLEKRLQALGIDSYALVKELQHMQASNDYLVSGQTGILSLNNQCVVQNQLSWVDRNAK